MHKAIKNLILIVLVLLGIAIIIYGVSTSDFSKLKKYDEQDSVISTKNAPPPSKAKQKYAKTLYYSTKVQITGDEMANLGDFSMNVNGGKILTANISLKYKDKKNSSFFSSNDTQAEIIQKGAILRSAVINAIHGSHTTINNDKIKDEIRHNLNNHLSEGEIEEVYFNKFIIQ